VRRQSHLRHSQLYAEPLLRVACETYVPQPRRATMHVSAGQPYRGKGNIALRESIPDIQLWAIAVRVAQEVSHPS
jgi:hypothetical protein